MTSTSGKYYPPDAYHALHVYKYVDENPMVTAYAGARRRIAVLEEQLQNIHDTRKKRKTCALNVSLC